MLEEYEGRIADIIFHNPKNGYTVAVFETDDDTFTAVGTLPSANAGRSYRITGHFIEHRTYGEQFEIRDFEEVLPSTAEGIRAFLASGVIKGIGAKTAASIVSTFGEESLEVIEKEPERLKSVPGIGDKTAAKISKAYNEQREFARIAMELQKYGITASASMRLYKTYGASTVDALMENPYALVDDVYGIGFRRADQIAERIGIAPDDDYRIQSGIKFTLSWFAGEGNTYIPEEMLREKASELLDQPGELIEENLRTMAFAGEVKVDMIEGSRAVYLMAFYTAEQNVAKCLRRLVNATLKPVNGVIDSLIAATETRTGITLTDNQKKAVSTCLDRGVTVITGGPGTGKTTIINSIIYIFEESGLKTAIAAPTGRAAKRITETSGHFASTIHRLLEYSPFENPDGQKSGFMVFGRNADNPLECDAVIIDEASMIDLMLMNGLVSAIREGTRLIIVGDDDQLPSVGAGNVLHDIIASEYVYSIRLTEIFRQARESMIVVNAHRINKGEYPDCNSKGKDFFLLRRKTEKEMLLTIKDLVVRRLPDYYAELDPISDIQVLTPVRKGTLGCIMLNSVLQSALNPPDGDRPEKTYGDKLFREGDKVMQIRNNYEMKWKNREDLTEGEGVFNGDMGYVHTIDNEFNEMTVVFDGCRYAVYNFNQLDELELAYAVTVHKSQGSEFPIVVMPVSWFPPVLATRNLLYTGVTRGKTAVVLVGSEDKLHGMVDNNRIAMRYSGLGWRLKQFLRMNGELG